MAWKVDTAMAIWGIAFGIVATLSGIFLLRALEGGVIAEAFFLIVVGWILVLLLVAKFVAWIRRGGR
jgi:hypothetical protein